FLDTEAYIKGDDVQEHTFRLAVVCYNDSYYRFNDLDELWKFIFSKVRQKKKLYVFAHNMHYDFFIIKAFDYLKANGYVIKSMLVDDHIFVVKARRHVKVNEASVGNSIIFIDTMNIFPFSVEFLGEYFGVPKVKVNFKRVSDEKLFQRCENDVKVIKYAIESLFDFIKKEQLGSFKPTIGALSFSFFRHKFMRNKIYIHKDQEATDIEMDSLKGGRCEAFYLGEAEGDFYKLDVNSLYPKVMRDNYYPVKLEGIVHNVDDAYLQQLEKEGYLVIAEALVITEKPCVGIKVNGKLIFPVGRFVGTFTSPELKLIRENGSVVKVFRATYYKKGKIFTKFVDYFYRKRLRFKRNGEKLFELFTKLIMNSLWGKFAQRTTVVEKALTVDDPKLIGRYIAVDEDGHDSVVYFINGEMYEAEKDALANDTFVAIASFVTAYGRCYLWRLMEQAGWENVYYVDTDCLIVNERGYMNLFHLVDEDKLGYLKVEGVAKYINIRGQKNYDFGEKRVIAGIKKDACITNGVAEQYVFYRAKELLRRGVTDKVIVEKRIVRINEPTISGFVKPPKIWIR
ncbi:MAG: DNA polymerase, partial [Nitrososphaerota archaeon]